MHLDVDFARYPAGVFGDKRIDVPFREPLGQLKRAARRVLREFPVIEVAHLVLCSDPAWGDAPQIVVAIQPGVETGPLYEVWKPFVGTFGQIGFFRAGDNYVWAFASRFTAPFYVKDDRVAAMPAYTMAELLRYVEALPDRPAFAGMAASLETLKERYDDLPADAAAREYTAQQTEMEHLLEAIRERATHARARAALIEHLTTDTPFALELRTFATETATGRFLGFPGDWRGWTHRRPMHALLAKLSPFRLIGVASPIDPFPPEDSLLLELGDDWLRVVRSLVGIADRIYVVCDRWAHGIVNELQAIQAAEREDDTFILVPGDDQTEYYRDLHTLMTDVDRPVNSAVLTRWLAAFGHTITTDELATMTPS